ncbi:MAG: fdrA domain protein [Candidatus Ranarchaeia archaeon]|jgi:hypothetical protein
MSKLLDQKIKAINVGIQLFTDTLRLQGVQIIHVEWSPPAQGNQELLKILDRLGS